MSTAQTITRPGPEAGESMNRLRREVREEMDRMGVSIAQVSREIGRGASTATLSTWLDGAYLGDVEAVARRLRRWLDTRRETARRALGGARLDRWVDLAGSEDVGLALTHAQAAGDIAAVYGPSGAGKTTALRRYCETRTGAHYTAASVAVRTPAGLLARVGEAVGAGGPHPSALAAESAVVRRLQGRGALLVVDEAHHLSAMLLDELRCIRDLAGCGLALAGHTALWMTLAGSRQCDQIVGRIGVRVALSAPARSDALALAAAVLGRAPTADEARIVYRGGPLARRAARAPAPARPRVRDRALRGAGRHQRGGPRRVGRGGGDMRGLIYVARIAGVPVGTGPTPERAARDAGRRGYRRVEVASAPTHEMGAVGRHLRCLPRHDTDERLLRRIVDEWRPVAEDCDLCPIGECSERCADRLREAEEALREAEERAALPDLPGLEAVA